MGIVGYSIIQCWCFFYDLETKDPIGIYFVSVDSVDERIDDDAFAEYVQIISRAIGARIMGISIDEYNEICDKYGIDGREAAYDGFDDDFDEDDDSVDLDGGGVDLSFAKDFVEAYDDDINDDDDLNLE